MIEPLYFPQTFPLNAERPVIRSLFGHVTVFSPSDGTVSGDSDIKPIVPVSGQEQELSAMVREYRAFSALNMERASSFLKGADRKPFYDESWASELRGEIIRRADGEPVEKNDSEKILHILWARFFLQIAHEYDEKNREIDLELEQVVLKEKQLMNNLMGGGDDQGFASSSRKPDPTLREGMIMARLRAWSILFAESRSDVLKEGQGVYVTGSPEVTELMGEVLPLFVKAGDVPLAGSDPLQLKERLEVLVTSPFQPDVNPVSDPSLQGLSLFVAPDMTPRELFSRFSMEKNREKGHESAIRNTVIGLIRI